MAGGETILQSLVILLFCMEAQIASPFTYPRDAAALLSLKDQWEKTPPSWRKSEDPCGGQWQGVVCDKNSRVIEVNLPSVGLKGALTGDIGGLTELISLNLAYNRELTGPISAKLGDLQKLRTLILVGCGFSGNIPPELGNLAELRFLALNSNNFTGEIPNSIGNISNVYLLDLSDNQLSGPIPVSTQSASGLDRLLMAKHFHLNKNKLSGPIPYQLFSSDMILIHVLLDGNQLTGSIPPTLALVKTLEVVRLDRNFLIGKVPSNLNNLTHVIELNLGYNNLTGPMPNLTGMNSLSYVDLSNNNFEESEAPEWFSTLSLTTLVIENGSLHGPVPQKLFSAPQLQQVKLGSNSFNGTLDMGESISQYLKLVDFGNNDISGVTLSSRYQNTTLNLTGNPCCSLSSLSNSDYCQPPLTSGKTYSTSLAKCGKKLCTDNEELSPLNCECAHPYAGTMYFLGPTFRELSNAHIFHELERALWQKLGLKPGSVSLQSLSFDCNDYLKMYVELFPSFGTYFNMSEVQRIGSDLASQSVELPEQFGPYHFIALPYDFPEAKSSFNLRLIGGIAAACSLLVLVILGLGIYAMKKKYQAETAMSWSRPFVSWGSSGNSGDAPQLKGARFYPYSELKRCTNNFSGSNLIGAGGYGKVYRGVLANGQQVAVKRSTEGSRQGGHEFKTEIELLSRVHHKNLVSLLGYCIEQEEQLLIYEYMPNGSLRKSLSGKSGISLDWRTRLRIALGSARGIAYLHDHASPPIIHRDIKSDNILLDETLGAKVADFGLCRLVDDTGKPHISTQVKGTMGYLDPEYYQTQQLSEKSDVYSFGVLMLELITAKKPVEKGTYIVREMRKSVNKNDQHLWGLADFIDPTLKNQPKLLGFENFVQLAMKCVEDSNLDRPTMSHVVKEIEFILQNDGIHTPSTSTSSSIINSGPM